jgi:hypothetical protein
MVDETLFIEDGNAVLPDEDKFGMRDLKLLAVRRANRKGPEPSATDPFL